MASDVDDCGDDDDDDNEDTCLVFEPMMYNHRFESTNTLTEGLRTMMVMEKRCYEVICAEILRHCCCRNDDFTNGEVANSILEIKTK
jgi:hypothetical protein